MDEKDDGGVNDQANYQKQSPQSSSVPPPSHKSLSDDAAVQMVLALESLDKIQK
jgi:hypothetical protein